VLLAECDEDCDEGGEDYKTAHTVQLFTAGTLPDYSQTLPDKGLTRLLVAKGLSSRDQCDIYHTDGDVHISQLSEVRRLRAQLGLPAAWTPAEVLQLLTGIAVFHDPQSVVLRSGTGAGAGTMHGGCGGDLFGLDGMLVGPWVNSKAWTYSQVANICRWEDVPAMFTAWDRFDLQHGLERKPSAETIGKNRTMRDYVTRLCDDMHSSCESWQWHNDHGKYTEVEVFCICQTPYVEGAIMVGCDKCDGWFHPGDRPPTPY
jgi:hypothetical protein